MRLTDDQGLRIRLRLDNYTLSDLPWEYAYLPDADTPGAERRSEGFLVLDRHLSLVRYEVLGQPPGKLKPRDQAVQMAVILSNPESPEFPALDLKKEEDLIKKALAGVNQIQYTPYVDATVEMLLDAVNAGAQILHFSGHGTFQTSMGETFGEIVGEGSIVMMGDDGKERLFSSGDLALSLRGSRVLLVVLGACEGGRRDGVNAWSGVAPALTRAGIPAVVGMQYKIYDKNAVIFSRYFYRALAAGQEIDDAMTAARVAIRTGSNDANERDWGVPVLYLHAEEGILFPEKVRGETTIAAPIEAGVSPVPAAGAPTSNPQEEKIDPRALRNAMSTAFAKEDLEVLCADVETLMKEDGLSEQFNLEIVGGSGKVGIILNLIKHLENRRQLHYLVKAVRSTRPGII